MQLDTVKLTYNIIRGFFGNLIACFPSMNVLSDDIVSQVL